MKLIPSTIQIRPNRQRKKLGDLTSLQDSIRRVGLINPITVTREGADYILVAGERRLTSWKEVKGDEPIEANLFEDLNTYDRERIELEENIKREDLTWQDRVSSIARIHEMYLQQNDSWSAAQTGEAIGLKERIVYYILQVVPHLGDPAIQAAPTFESALNVIERRLQHAIDRQTAALGAAIAPPPVEDIMKIVGQQTTAPATEAGMATAPIAPAIQSPPASPLPPAPLLKPYEILHTDFHTWAAEYSGEPFTFLHVDFPYGINYDKSDQANAADNQPTYEDSREVFEALMDTLANHQDRFVSRRAHMIFWYPSGEGKGYQISQRLLAMGWKVLLVPLIWFRSDNRGIAADVERRPRHVYENAFLCSRGDRKIFSLVSDVYAAPTLRERHPSCKPATMLEHFFRMTIDEYTTVLDPTCGSGTSIEAAVRLGARASVGIERNADFASIAATAVTRAYRLRAANRALGREDSPSRGGGGEHGSNPG